VGKLTSYNGEAALYVGFDTLTEKKVAIKEYMPDALCTRAREVLPLSVNTDELALYKTYMSEFIELNRSLQSLGTLSGIQRVTDVFSENNTAYAVLEYNAGVSLKAYIAQQFGGFMSVEQARELFPPVFKALGRVNAGSIVHRGISPTTVFVNETSGLYLSDFSITAARIYGSKINEEVFAGYAAPEQYNSLERHGDWTDVYGMSALLYNVLTGIDPPDAQSRLISDDLTEPMLINSHIPEKISKAIIRGLTLSAENRIKNINELCEQLFGKLRTADISKSKTLTEIPVSATFWNTTDTGLPITPDVDIDFDDDEEEKPRGKFDADLVEAVEKSIRKEAREKQRKIKMGIVISAVTLVVIFFIVTIVLALDGYFDKDPAVTEDPSETTTVTTAETTTSLTSATTEEYIPGTPVLVRRFEGLDFRQEWVSDFPGLRFKFEPEYRADHRKNFVFFQSIQDGQRVPEGTEIVIKYSLGKEFIKLSNIPDYVGMTVGDLRNELNRLGVDFLNIRIGDENTMFIPSMANQIVGGVNGNNLNADIRITSLPGVMTRQADIVIIHVAAIATTETTVTVPTTTASSPTVTTRTIPTITTTRTTTVTTATTVTTTPATTTPVTTAPTETTTPEPVTPPPVTDPPAEPPPPLYE